MSQKPALLLNRLQAIGDSLSQTPGALGLLGLGSVGEETARLDEYSDLDFFVLVERGYKHTFISDLSWLSRAAPLGYAFQNTPDGWKALYEDGIYCEFAVFDLDELRGAAYTGGRWVWKRPEVPEMSTFMELKAPVQSPPSPGAWNENHVVGEALTNLYVGLMRFHRGEKLAAMRFIQGYALDRVLEMVEHDAPGGDFRDPFGLDRRFEQRHPGVEMLLASLAQGYQATPASAMAILAFIENRTPVNPTLRQAVLDLCVPHDTLPPAPPRVVRASSEKDGLALLGGLSIREVGYPAWPVADERDAQALRDVLHSEQWGGFPYPGPVTRRFQDRFAEMQGGEYAVAMANGTLTMVVALQAAGIGWGDEVIVPAYTFAATATAPILAGAVPVLVDIDPENYCIDPHAVEAAITPQTRAIIPVHLGSQMADMDALVSLARKHNLVIIEDAAHAPGASWDDQGAGALGDFGSFSFQSFKTLTTGEGGLLLCKTPEMAYKAASLVDCGRPHDPAGELRTFGYNLRLAEFAAALGLVGLERFPAQFAERAQNAALLEEALSEVEGVRLMRRDVRQTKRSHYRYFFGIDPQVFGVPNHMVVKALQAEGIPCWEGYPPMHQYDLFQPHLSHLPAAVAYQERNQKNRISLPVVERVSSLEAVWLYESTFRAGEEGVLDVARALQKLLRNKEMLVRTYGS